MSVGTPLPRTGFVILLLLAAMAFQLAGIAQSSNFSASSLREALVVGAGAEVSLPPRVIVARRLLGAANAGSVALSEALMRDSLFHQRLSEYAYPVRVLPESPWRLASPAESLPGECREIDRSDDLVLYRCSHAEG